MPCPLIFPPYFKHIQAIQHRIDKEREAMCKARERLGSVKGGRDISTESPPLHQDFQNLESTFPQLHKISETTENNPLESPYSSQELKN
jgi:hypothetical protein